MITSHRATMQATRPLVMTLLLAAATLTLCSCATPPAGGMAMDTVEPAATLTSRETAQPEAEEKLGIRVTGLHLSAHGYVIDLRYRVTDKLKAAPLLDSRKKVYLLDAAHGARLGVPESPIIGGMRQTSRNKVIYTDRDYFVLFVNPGRAVQAGDVLKLAIDNTVVADLKVE